MTEKLVDTIAAKTGRAKEEIYNIARRMGWAELEEMNLQQFSWNEARAMVHDGTMPQDHFDLYDDMWNVSKNHFSVPDYAVRQSYDSLVARYQERLETLPECFR